MKNKLPHDWQIVKLGDIAQIVNGTTPSTINDEYWGGDIVWITPKDLGKLEHKEVYSSERLITKDGFNSCNLSLIPRDSILLSTRAPIGYIAINKVELCFNQGCKGIIADKSIDNNYLFYFLFQSKNKLENLGSGATFKELSTEKIKKFEIILPPLFEQKRIADVIETKLQAVERVKKVTNEQLELTESLLDSYISKVYNGKKYNNVRLDKMSLINPTTKGKIPQDSDMRVTFVPMSAVDAAKGEISNEEVRPVSQVRKGYTYFVNNDILFAKITPCMQNGKHAIAKNLKTGIGFGSTEFHIIKPLENVIPEWIHFYLRQKRYLLDAENNMQGAVGQQRLPENYLKETLIPLPSTNEQRIIIEDLKSKDNKIRKIMDNITEQLSFIDALQSSILRQAFKGKL
jgi:type I restriction enzyme S subunit